MISLALFCPQLLHWKRRLLFLARTVSGSWHSPQSKVQHRSVVVSMCAYKMAWWWEWKLGGCKLIDGLTLFIFRGVGWMFHRRGDWSPSLPPSPSHRLYKVWADAHVMMHWISLLCWTHTPTFQFFIVLSFLYYTKSALGFFSCRYTVFIELCFCCCDHFTSWWRPMRSKRPGNNCFIVLWLKLTDDKIFACLW